MQDAIISAEKENLDLVEVGPNASPPVCRILDFGKFKYRQTKKEKEAKKKQHVVKVKEIKLRPRIDPHDFTIKLDSAKKFLAKGCKVKLTLVFRGREMSHKEIGESIFIKFTEEIVDQKLGLIESEVKKMGKTETLVIAPFKAH